MANENKLDTNLWHLNQINVLSELDKPGMMRLAKLVSDQQCPKDEIFYVPGDLSNKLFFLKMGKVKIVSISESGKEMIQQFMMPGEIFGELALVSSANDQRGHLAEAVEPSTVCSIDANVFRDFLEDYPKLNFTITKLIGFRFKKIQRKLSDLWFKTADQRIKGFIKEMATDYGKDVGYERVLRMKLTHQDIASMTATSRQTVTTTLSQLEKDGVITYDRSRILVRDMSKL